MKSNTTTNSNSNNSRRTETPRGRWWRMEWAKGKSPAWKSEKREARVGQLLSLAIRESHRGGEVMNILKEFGDNSLRAVPCGPCRCR